MCLPAPWETFGGGGGCVYHRPRGFPGTVCASTCRGLQCLRTRVCGRAACLHDLCSLMVVFLSRFLCDCCSVLAVMFVTAVIASRGGKGKSYCCIFTLLLLVWRLLLSGSGVMLGVSCTGMFPSLSTCVRLARSGEAGGAPCCWDNTSGRSSCTQMPKTHKFGPETGSVQCDWTFMLHVPECFKK